MNKVTIFLVFFTVFVFPVNLYASLIGDSVTVDRRYNNTAYSSRTTDVDSDIELIGWQNLYVDFRDYEIVMYPMMSIGYAPTEFNGFDFYDLDFALESESIFSVSAHYVSIFNHSEIIEALAPERLGFSDDWISLNLAGKGFGSHPLYISIETRVSEVPLPSSMFLFLSGISILILRRSKLMRLGKHNTYEPSQVNKPK
jgi:hypothetical protein